jgi:hypothetical protein
MPSPRIVATPKRVPLKLARESRQHANEPVEHLLDGERRRKLAGSQLHQSPHRRLVFPEVLPGSQPARFVHSRLTMDSLVVGLVGAPATRQRIGGRRLRVGCTRYVGLLPASADICARRVAGATSRSFSSHHVRMSAAVKGAASSLASRWINRQIGSCA